MVDVKLTDGVDGYNARVTARERFAIGYDRSYRPTMLWLASALNGRRVLDFGCGDGSMWYTVKKDTVVDGLDADRLNRVARWHSWDEVEGKYDVVLFHHVLEHMKGGYEESVCHVQKALEYAPHAMIVVPNAYENVLVHPKGEPTHMCDPYNHSAFCVLLEENGILVERQVRSDVDHMAPLYRLASRIEFAWRMGTSPFYDHIIVCKKKGATEQLTLQQPSTIDGLWEWMRLRRRLRGKWG